MNVAEKKIEAIVDSNINIVRRLVPDSPINNYETELRGLMIGCIKRGVELALEGLWHPAEEEPNIKEERQLVCLFLDKGAEKILPVYVSKTMDWKKFCEVNGVLKWYFIDDLTKKGGKK